MFILATPIVSCAFGKLHLPETGYSHSLQSALLASLPQECGDSSQIHSFDNQTLYQYINGGADLFLKYGFKQLYGVVCTAASDTIWVTLDVYDMSYEENARQLFQNKCSKAPSLIRGYNAVCEGDSFILGHAGRYYVEIQSNGAQPNLTNLLHDIAERFADKLP